MSQNEHTSDHRSIDISEDRARAVEEAGRRAGAALRSPAPALGAAAIEARVHRRRVVRVTATTACVGVLLVAGVIALRRDDESVDQRPADTLPATVAPTVAPATIAVPPAADHGALEGRWTTAAIPIEQVRTTMLDFGLHEEDVAQWVRDVGSPSELTFGLEFNGNEFSHDVMTPERPRQVDEAGTFVYDANHKMNGGVTAGRLTLSLADQGETFEVDTDMRCCDELTLHFVDSPRNADMTAAEVVRAVPLYTSAPFHRVDDRDTRVAG